MANRLPYLASALVLSLSACGSPVPADQLIRTADPYARGYTDDDFPRIQELAAGLTTGNGIGGESSLGDDSDGFGRVNTTPCVSFPVVRTI